MSANVDVNPTARYRAGLPEKGDRVQLADTVRHPEFRGMTGKVRRYIKSRRVVDIVLDSGKTYEAIPDNVLRLTDYEAMVLDRVRRYNAPREYIERAQNAFWAGEGRDFEACHAVGNRTLEDFLKYFAHEWVCTGATCDCPNNPDPEVMR